MATVAVGSAVHAQIWTGAAGDNVWANPANWSAGVPNVSTAFADFNAASVASGPIDLGPFIFGNQMSLARLTFSNIAQDFSFTNSIASPPGVLNLFGDGGSFNTSVLTSGGAGRLVTLHNDIRLHTSTAFNLLPNSARQRYTGTISSAQTSGATLLSLTGRTNNIADAIRIDGRISDGTAGARLVIDTGYTPDGGNHRSIVTLANDTNDFTGRVWVKTNTLNFTSVANIGQPSALGRGNASFVNDDTLYIGDLQHVGIANYTGTDPAGHSTNRILSTWATTGRGELHANGAGSLTWNGNAVVRSSTSTPTLVLAGDSTAVNTFNGVIGPNPGTGALSLNKSGSTTWVLTADNTYEGTTTVSGGRLRLLNSEFGSPTFTAGPIVVNAGVLELVNATIKATDLDVAGGGQIDFKSGLIQLTASNTTTGINSSIVIGTQGTGTLSLTGGSQRFSNVALGGADDALQITGTGVYEVNNLDNGPGGTVSLSAGALQINNNGRWIENISDGVSRVVQGRVQGSGGITKQGPGTLRLAGGLSHTFTGQLRIEQGTVTVEGSSAAIGNTTPVFVIAGATFDISGRTSGETVGPITGSGTIITGPDRPLGINVVPGITTTFDGRITGAGGVIKTGDARLNLTGASDFTGPLTLNNATGTTLITGTGSIAGASEVAIGNATLTVDGGLLETSGRMVFTNAFGVLRIDNGGTVIANRFDRTSIAGTLSWLNGTLRLTSGGRIAATHSNLATFWVGTLPLTSSRSLTVVDALTLDTGGTLQLDGGSMTADDLVFAGTGAFNFNSGTLRLRDGQMFTAARIAQLDLAAPIDQARSLTIDGSLELDSTLTLNGGSITAGQIVHPHRLILNGGTLAITAGALVTDATLAPVNAFNTTIDVTGALDNAGTLNLIGSAASFSAASTSTGELNAIHTTLDFASGLASTGTLNLIHTTLTGPVELTGSTTLAGTNTFAGDVAGTGGFDGPGSAVFEGTYRPGAGLTSQISFGSDAALASGAVLQIDLRGPEAGVGFDQLLLGGTFAFDGALVLDTTGYDPAMLVAHRIVEAGSLNGIASGVSGSVLSSGKSLAVMYDATGVSVTATVPGDANVDGSVNFVDLLALAQNYGQAGGDWARGDFDYDGAVGFIDLLALAQNFNTVAYGDASVDLGTPGLTADWALARSLVPEPAMLTLVCAAVGLLARRR
jgi:autotransporter-associated beta strand protein